MGWVIELVNVLLLVWARDSCMASLLGKDKMFSKEPQYVFITYWTSTHVSALLVPVGRYDHKENIQLRIHREGYVGLEESEKNNIVMIYPLLRLGCSFRNWHLRPK